MQSFPTSPPPSLKTYGNSPKLLLKAAFVGVCMGALAAAASAYALYMNGRTHSWEIIVLLLLGAPTLLVIGVLPWVLFHIRLTNGSIQRVFLGDRVIDEYRAEDFVTLDCLEIGLLAVIRFRCGGRIPILGVGWPELNRLLRDIRNQHR